MKFLRFFIFLTLVSIFSAAKSPAQQKFEDIEDVYMSQTDPKTKYFGNITAPDFPAGAEWLNTDKPLSIKDFRGKLVLLDFWTFCCINCMHIIPDLKKLEEKYDKELVVIGVHSAKFLTERGTENIRQAILRYDISHPVINDKDFEVWNQYTASAWPTLVLIDPRGKVIGMSTGEGVFKLFDPIITEALSAYDKAGEKLNLEPVKFKLEKNKAPKSLLSYPGKIAADASNGLLYITDSNNNRVIVLKTGDKPDEVQVVDVIGSGKQGAKDGSYNEAEFFRPQGITVANGKLYIADTENHLIREVDLSTKQVKTIAGTGSQSTAYGWISGSANETALNSPWDVLVKDNKLYVAMAGAHQIWVMDLATNQIMTFAGSGRENIVDGSFEKSALAQTSGLTTDGSFIYFADSEVSAVRSAGLGSNGKVKTIVGEGLFEYGDVDGQGSTVRLQHPLGIAYNNADKLLYVADTYNNKIKVIDPVNKTSVSYSGTGYAGTRDGKEEAQFNEPSGLIIVNGKIYVTDTNNHLIRVIDMQTKEVKTLRITNPDKLMASVKNDMKRKVENAITLSIADLKSGESKLRFNFKLPEGYHINPEALPEISVWSDENVVTAADKEIDTKVPHFELPVKLNGTSGKVNVEVLIYYCDTENAGICKFRDLNFVVPVNISPSGSDTYEIKYELM